MAHLPSDTVQRLAKLERELKHAQAMSEQPKLPQVRRIFWQVHARTLQGQIEVLEAMAQSSRQAFGELEQARQEELA